LNNDRITRNKINRYKTQLLLSLYFYLYTFDKWESAWISFVFNNLQCAINNFM